MSDIFEFEDKARVERLVGTLHDPGATPGDVLTVQADGSVAAAPGGGSMPTGQQAISTNVSKANAGNVLASWTAFGGGYDQGPALLDLTDPLNPAIIAAGTYAVSVVLQSIPDTPAAALGDVNIALGTYAGESIVYDQSLAESTATFTLVFSAGAGDLIVVSFDNGLASNCTFYGDLYLRQLA